MIIDKLDKIAILIGIVLSVAVFSFILTRFIFKKLFSDKSSKRTKYLIWLTTLILTTIILYLITYLILTPKFPDLEDFIDGWEIETTYQVYPNKTISVIDNSFKINSGKNNVLVVSREVIPIVKVGQDEPADLRSTRNLIIELNKMDTLVSPSRLGSSKILREILAFSPDYGITQLDKEEKIEIKIIGKNRWMINSDLDDFQFKVEFSFNDSLKLTNKYIDK